MVRNRIDKKQVSLREATDNDLELMMAWRSNPVLYRHFNSQGEALKWEEHYHWWKSRRNRRDWIIVLHEGERTRDVGSVNVSSLDTNNPQVGVYIGETELWGRGIARHSVSLAVEWLSDNGYRKARASVAKDNVASLKVFEVLGFKRVGEGREGQWMYEVELQ